MQMPFYVLPLRKNVPKSEFGVFKRKWSKAPNVLVLLVVYLKKEQFFQLGKSRLYKIKMPSPGVVVWGKGFSS